MPWVKVLHRATVTIQTQQKHSTVQNQCSFTYTHTPTQNGGEEQTPKRELQIIKVNVIHIYDDGWIMENPIVKESDQFPREII